MGNNVLVATSMTVVSCTEGYSISATKYVIDFVEAVSNVCGLVLPSIATT